MGRLPEVNRRNVLKKTAAGIVGAAGVSALSAPASAKASEGQTYSQYTMQVFDAGGSSYEVHTGAGLTVADIADGSNYYNTHKFKIAQDIVVTERWGDEMPVTESEGYGDDCYDRVDHPAAADLQEFHVNIDSSDTENGTIAMGADDIWMSPTRCDGQPAYDQGPSAEIQAAVGALDGIVGAFFLGNPYASATLAGTLTVLALSGDTLNDEEVDISEYWSGTPFFRGGFDAHFGITVEDVNYISALVEAIGGKDLVATNEIAWDITCTDSDVYVNQP